MNLMELSQSMKALQDLTYNLGLFSAGGITHLENLIPTIRDVIENNNYQDTFFSMLDYEDKKTIDEKFNIFQSNIPKIKNLLAIDFFNTFNQNFHQDDFEQQWNQLSNQDKTTLLFYSEHIYKTIREKMPASFVNFYFDDLNVDDGVFDNTYPDLIFNWIFNAKNKVDFHKLRKEAKNTEHELFFNSEETKKLESHSSDERKKYAIKYLTPTKGNGPHFWYNRLDAFLPKKFGPHIPFFYGMFYFLKLEDEFSQYDKKNIVLPDILLEWAGQNKDGTASASKELSKDEFNNLKLRSIGTDYESFFAHEITQKMATHMPYARKEYMFVFLRDHFKNQSKNSKLKM